MATYALGEKTVLLRSEDDVAVAKAYRHMAEDMDLNCGVVLEGTPIATVGRQIFEEVIAVASGKRSKSELSGVGEEEFAPWIIGPVM